MHICTCKDVAMGSHANAVAVDLPEHMHDYRDNRVAAGLSPQVGVDRCILPEIAWLWSQSVVTHGSCCGHGIQPGNIIVANPFEGAKMQVLGYEPWPDAMNPGLEFLARGVPEGEHAWFPFSGMTCCRLCGIVKRADGLNRPCPGLVGVCLREIPA